MQRSITVDGRGGLLFVPFIIIAACAIGAPMYYSDVLPEFCVQNAEKVIATVVAFEFGLLLGVAFLRGRKIILNENVLMYSSWFSDARIRVDTLTDLTLQADHSHDSGTTYYLTFWRATESVLRINPLFWDRASLSVLLRQLIERRPAIHVSPEVRPYLAPANAR